MANVEQRQLEVVQAYASIIIDQKSIEHQAGGFKRYINTVLPIQCENAVLTIVELFAADNIRNIEIEYPRDWWEAVKERWAPRWFTNRWPIIRRTHRIDIKAIWQGYKPPTDKYGPYLPYVFERSFEGGLDE